MKSKNKKRRRVMFNPRKILVTTDFSDASDSALREAADIARRFNSQVHLLHVIEDIRQCAVDYCISEAEIAAEKNKLREEAGLKMNNEISRTVTSKSFPLFAEVRFGNTVDAIIDYERDNNIDLVITAPHRGKKRNNSLRRHLTSELVKKSVCETMVVK
jgi:nucleotide-binding universal stress UspA family protein